MKPTNRKLASETKPGSPSRPALFIARYGAASAERGDEHSSCEHADGDAERCDAHNCGRSPDVVRDGRRWCSWHWAEYQFNLKGVWVNPTAKAG